MSPGPNGLDPRDQLAEKAKCPLSPTKRKYLHSEEAWDAAHHRSAESGLEIVAYACPGCGHFHLSRKAKGSDVVVKAPVGISTGALRKNAAALSAFNGAINALTERKELPPEGPPVPSNVAARRKVLMNFLEGKDEVSTDDVARVLQASRHTVWKYMNELGWKSSRGPGAMWRPRPKLTAVEDTGQSTGDVELEASIARHPASRGQEWWLIEAFPPGISVQDYLLTLKTAGLVVEVRVRRAL